MCGEPKTVCPNMWSQNLFRLSPDRSRVKSLQQTYTVQLPCS